MRKGCNEEIGHPYCIITNSKIGWNHLISRAFLYGIEWLQWQFHIIKSESD